MNKKFFTAWAIIFIVWMMGSFIVHALLLEADYMLLPNLFRSNADSQQYFPLMIVAHVIMSGALVWIYARGAEKGPWMGQGFRFGIAIALLMIVPIYLIYFVVQPMPFNLVIKQIVFDGMLQIVLGLVLAFFYRNAVAGTCA